jgi:hypothetical protein
MKCGSHKATRCLVPVPVKFLQLKSKLLLHLLYSVLLSEICKRKEIIAIPTNKLSSKIYHVEKN